jgi:hypothetical protein
MNTKTCIQCNKKFTSPHPLQKRCPSCIKQGYKIQCKRCNKTFYTQSRSKYCSEECRFNSPYGAKYTCEGCSTIFIRTHITQKFCSKECANKYGSIKIVKKTCKNCGKIFISNDYEKEVCSKKCYKIYYTQKLKQNTNNINNKTLSHLGYCVYGWVTPDRPNLPAYVGLAGPDERPYEFHKDGNGGMAKCEKWRQEHPDCEVIIIVDGLTEQGAKLTERILIQVYRKLGGCECNIHSGSKTIGKPPLTIWGNLT